MVRHHQDRARSDNAPGIATLVRSALTEAKHTVVCLGQISEEHPSRYDPSGNATAEQAVEVVTGFMRANKIDVESRLEMRLPLEHPLSLWLVECSAWMGNITMQGRG